MVKLYVFKRNIECGQLVEVLPAKSHHKAEDYKYTTHVPEASQDDL